ncbi:hypothetical protein C1E23_18695 [Pseudoalteromonas phenolica]|uniref:OmpR/PhoB-type domain-containing protein n=1 Tax=Pseudoalteromonas phenolica TaxID=161398 RepID=A0A4Q7IK26_9GAMM|nr:winged helix-turn-helix domain-containing protein [Pseudoalteromonas phenolica]RZQ51586.1 hypothetical protein C1E23_18695 [Pseudoalteromonas phenolica]
MLKENTILVGNWRVKLDGLSIQNKHQHKDLDAKVMQLLVYLIDNRERVVSRNELLDQLWKNQVVADDVLNVAMSSLRKALGDNFKNPNYIKTLPRNGYQLIAPVKPIASKKLSKKVNWMFFTLLILMAAIALWFQFPSVDELSETSPVSSQPIRLAVLPFDYYSADQSRKYIADGLTEAIINKLVQESALQITSRASVMQYKTETTPINTIAQQLNVEWILEGSIQIEDDTIQVTAQLINADKDVHLWSETYQRKLNNLLAIQTEFAADIVTRLNISSTQMDEDSHNSSINKIPIPAYDRFMQAQFFHFEGESDKAIIAYQQAIELYPNYAQAYAHLSHSYFSKSYSGGIETKELIDRASKLANKALALNPEPAYVQLVTALTFLYQDYNYQAAGQAFQLAFARNNQDLMILEWYIEFLLITEQNTKAEQLTQHMVTVSPMAYNKTRAFEAFYYQGDFTKAIQEVEKKAEILSIKSQKSLYFWTALASNNNDLLLEHGPAYLNSQQLSDSAIKRFITILKNQGQKSALQFIIEKATTLSPYDKAKLYTFAGENEKAIVLLQTLVAQRNIHMLKLAIEPAFKLLNNEPDYVGLLNQLKLNSH